MKNKLNVGCGKDILKNYVNLDIANLPGVDVIHNIEKTPWPLKKNHFVHILCQDVLEHVNYIPVLKELHKILKKRGKLTVRVPHFTSVNNYIDPTHKNKFSIETFNFFINKTYYFDFNFTKIIKSKIFFQKKWLFLNYIIEFLVNMNKYTKKIYESTGLCYLFPAENIYIELEK